MTHRREIRRKLTAGLAVLGLSLALTPVQAVTTTYRDVDNSLWYAAPIAFGQQHRLMDGTGRAAFAPEEPMDRAVLAEALYRLAGSPLPQEEETGELAEGSEENPEAGPDEAPEEGPFSDVAADHPYAPAIRWAKEAGIVSGYADGAFGPEDPITREQIAALLWNVQGRPEAEEAPFTDRAEISPWALPALDWAYDLGLLSGDLEGRALPQNDASRAEGAAILTNYAKKFHGLQPGWPLPAAQTVKPNPYDPEEFRLDERGYLSYVGTSPSYRGVDVSDHQKEIDWAKVAATGMDFAMIRAGYRGYTAGDIYKDAQFEANIQGALSNGMEVGVYFFSQALTPAEAEEEAYQVLEWIQGYPIAYPVVFDWEEQDKDGSRTRGADGNTVTACALAFCKVIQDAGYTPMTYGSPNKIYRERLLLDRLQDYPFWLAHYTIDTAPTSFRYSYQMWQYSSTGSVDGIQGNVDLDICLVYWPTWKTGGRPWWIGPV